MRFEFVSLLSPVQAKSVMVVEVTAPAWLHRFIIGKKGQNIGRITQQLPRVRGEMIRNQRLNAKFFFLFFLFVLLLLLFFFFFYYFLFLLFFFLQYDRIL